MDEDCVMLALFFLVCWLVSCTVLSWHWWDTLFSSWWVNKMKKDLDKRRKEREKEERELDVER